MNHTKTPTEVNVNMWSLGDTRFAGGTFYSQILLNGKVEYILSDYYEGIPSAGSDYDCNQAKLNHRSVVDSLNASNKSDQAIDKLMADVQAHPGTVIVDPEDKEYVTDTVKRAVLWANHQGEDIASNEFELLTCYVAVRVNPKDEIPMIIDWDLRIGLGYVDFVAKLHMYQDGVAYYDVSAE